MNPLSVSSNKGKKSLILDLRYVNLHIWKDSVKFEDWKVFSNYLTKDCYIFKFDLKSGYHHLDIYPPHQTCLGFSWVIDGQERYFCFTVLPFGPDIFTKLLRPLVKFWRYHGLLIVIYIDDGICISIGLEQALRNSRFIKDSLKKADFVANSESPSGFLRNS